MSQTGIVIASLCWSGTRSTKRWLYSYHFLAGQCMLVRATYDINLINILHVLVVKQFPGKNKNYIKQLVSHKNSLTNMTEAFKKSQSS